MYKHNSWLTSVQGHNWLKYCTWRMKLEPDSLGTYRLTESSSQGKTAPNYIQIKIPSITKLLYANNIYVKQEKVEQKFYIQTFLSLHVCKYEEYLTERPNKIEFCQQGDYKIFEFCQEREIISEKSNKITLPLRYNIVLYPG